jgi:hypothetical protein
MASPSETLGSPWPPLAIRLWPLVIIPDDNPEMDTSSLVPISVSGLSWIVNLDATPSKANFGAQPAEVKGGNAETSTEDKSDPKSPCKDERSLFSAIFDVTDDDEKPKEGRPDSDSFRSATSSTADSQR